MGFGDPVTPRDASNASVGSVTGDVAIWPSPGCGAQASSSAPNEGVPDLPKAGVVDLSTAGVTSLAGAGLNNSLAPSIPP